jgi:hypothetical protein
MSKRAMSGLKKTENLHTLKTKELVMQNPDGSFPQVNSLLAFEDSRGRIVPTVDITVNSINATSIEVTDFNAKNYTIDDLSTQTVISQSIMTLTLDASDIQVMSKLTVGDTITIDASGNISATTIQVGQGLNVGGNISATTIQVEQGLNVGDTITLDASGNISATTIQVEQGLNVGGNISATTIQVEQGLNVGDTITLDASGNISATTIQVEQGLNVGGNIFGKTITVGEGIPDKAAVTSNGSDIIANTANSYIYGDQAYTGSLQAAYVTLPDFKNAQQATYLWANNNALLWQDVSSTILNVSDAVKKQAIGTTIQLASDLSGCISAVNTLLTYFANQGLFLSTTPAPAPTPPTPPPPPAPPTPPTILFQSPCSIKFIFSPINPIGPVIAPSFTYTSPSTIPLDALCTAINAITNGAFVFSNYCTLSYSPQNVQVTINPKSGYAVTINDVNYAGEAVRFCNHIGITNIVAGRVFSLPDVGSEFVTQNTSPPYSPPAVTAGTSGSSSTVLTIIPPASGPSNPLQYYGIYMDVSSGVTNLVDLLDISTNPITYTITYTPSATPTQINIYVYSIDTFNQSLTSGSVSFTPPAPPVPYPPAGYVNGYIVNGAQTPSTGDFLNPLVPYSQVAGGISNTYTFTIVPHFDLVNICFRVNVDDGTVITFTGTQPTGAPSPLINIPGPQCSYGSGGSLQYSQPITLTANTPYTINMTYYNTPYTTCIFTLGYVVPTAANPWSAGPGYTCPALDPLVQQNLSQFCFIPPSTV